MATETRMFFADLVDTGKNPLGILASDQTFMNERIAELYGVSGVVGDEFRPVSVSGLARGGIVTHPSVLTMNSTPNKTAVVHRGVWLLESILCDAPPPPPPNVMPQSVPPDFGGTERDIASAHEADPACKSCHQVIDGLGFGLLNYDGIGRWRDEDNGHAIDAAGSFPDGTAFEGPEQLLDLLASSDRARECLTQHFLTYALSRRTSQDSDGCHLEQITSEGVQADKSLADFVMAVVTSEPFLKQRGDEGVEQ